MTNGSESSPASEGTPETPASSGSASTFGTPTGMVELGGIILIVTYIIFGLVLNDYWVGWIAVLLAVSAVFLNRMDSSFMEKIAPVPVLLKVIGYLLVVIGVLVLIEDLRFASGSLNEPVEVIGALASYAGYAIAFLGARSIKA